MAERSIVVRLRAEVSDFNAQMAQAARAADKTTAQFDKNGQRIQTEMGRMVRSAEVSRDAWMTVGSALTAVGAAIVGVGAAALKTGIAYNTLQQTSRAALTTLLGSAEAANAQMDKLDEFARTSPFAKQVFINAQRQMLGFGIAAEKVIPYLDAIQNSVAAMGGSNHDLSEIVRIMSQISASAKITATDLREFGNRGIDAATIIGSQMGKTGAEIRASITAGTLDAQAALDALAAGMQERFGGAAEGVKSTFEGALDRVRAAWRDLAAELAEPLVDPQGGGALIGLFNAVADGARWFQALPGPVKTATVALSAFVGVSSLASGTFLLMGPRILETRVAMARLATDMPKVSAAMRGMTRAAGIAAAGLAVVTLELELARRMGEGWVSEVEDMTAKMGELDAQGLDNLTASLREFAAEIEGSRNAWDLHPYVEAWRDLGRDKGLIAAREAIVEINEASANTTINLTHLARQTGLSFDALRDLAEMNGIDLSDAMGSDSARIAREKMLELAAGVKVTQAATDALSKSTKAYVDALKAQTSALREASGATLTEWDALTQYSQAVWAATDAVAENGATLDANTEAGRANRDALSEIVSAAWDWVEAGAEAGVSSQELTARMQESRDAFIATAVQMGMTRDEAEALASEMGLIPSSIVTQVSLAGARETYQYLANINAELRKIQGNGSVRVAMGAGGSGGLAFAEGGAVVGPGSATSDSILARLSNGEHVWTAREVAAAGGHAAMYAMRQSVLRGYANGGAVGYAPSAPSVNVSPSLGDVIARFSQGQVQELAAAIVQAARTTQQQGMVALASELTLANRQGGVA